MIWQDAIRLLTLSIGGLNLGLGAVVMGFVTFGVKYRKRQGEIERPWGIIAGVGYLLLMLVSLIFIRLRLGQEFVWFCVVLLISYLFNIAFIVRVAFVVRSMNESHQ